LKVVGLGRVHVSMGVSQRVGEIGLKRVNSGMGSMKLASPSLDEGSFDE
jgi:hypothetical protein